MIVVRILEAGEAFDAGDDGVAPEARLAKLEEIGPGGPFLLRVQGEQRAAILRAVIRTLIVERGRFGAPREEDAQNRDVADLTGGDGDVGGSGHADIASTA